MATALHPQTLQRFAQNSDLLHCLDEPGITRLARVGELQHVPARAVVLREGEPSYDLYLLAAGELLVTMLDVPGREMARLQQGAFFGEMAMITHAPRSATVTAVTNSQVVRFAYDAVEAILRDYPQANELLGRIGLARAEANMQVLLKEPGDAPELPLVADFLQPPPPIDACPEGNTPGFALEDTPPVGILPPSRRPPDKS